MHSHRHQIVAALVAVLGFTLTASASAQEPGVTYDEGSPAGKEYIVPLDDARGLGEDDGAGTAAPRSGGGGGETAPAAEARQPSLFGQGISETTSGRGAEDKARPERGSHDRAKRRDSVGMASNPAPLVEQALAASSSQRGLTAGLIGLGILLLAGLTVAVVRARRGRAGS